MAIGNTELLQVADAVAREKSISKDLIIEAMEASIAIAARKKYGHGKIKSEIDRKTGEIKLFREFEVVANDYVEEESENNTDNVVNNKIKFDDALLKDDQAKIGEVIKEPLPPIELGHVAAQTAKQVIVQKVRDAVREKQYEDFKQRIGEVVNGIVKRIEFGNIIVDLGNAEAIIRRDELIKGETFKVNDRVRSYLRDVSRETKGPQIILSRTSNEFMAKLFEQEVPEIYDNIIEIKSVAREPGSRAKIAVFASDSNIDPVGSCVGIRGSRVQAVISELRGEKIDIIQWSADPATFVVKALAPSEVTKVVIDEEKKTIEAAVPTDQLSLAIGRRGQNVRLASQLLGWKVNVLTEEDEAKKRSEDFSRISELFVEALNIEDIIAHLLVSEGFSSVEEVAYVEINELSTVEGFDEDIAQELQNRAREYLQLQKSEQEKAYSQLNIDKDLIDFEGLNYDILKKLSENNIKNLKDFADLSHDEFIEIVPESGLTNEKLDALIMTARAQSYDKNEEAAE